MTYNNRGSVYLTLGRFKEAIADFNRALQIDPRNAIVFLNRGLAMLLTGKSVEAQQDFDQGLKIAGQNRETLEKNIQEIKQQLAAKPRQ